MSLRREALQIIDDLGLVDLLSQYGEARIVGSVALDLVVKLDIDIHLVLNSLDLMESVDEIVRSVLNMENIQEIRISDYRQLESIKLGIDAYPGVSGVWSIDIWITTDRETTAFAQTARLLEEMLPEHRATILELKREFHREGLLRDGLSSLIYEAVVNNHVESVAEFLRYKHAKDDAF